VSESLVEVTFALDDTSLDEYEQQEFAKKLLKPLREQGDAETVERAEEKQMEIIKAFLSLELPLYIAVSHQA
jgi:hypothetical protein